MTPADFASHAAEIASLKATVAAQSREIRDLKNAAKEQTASHAAIAHNLSDKLDALTLQIAPFLKSAERIDALLAEADRQDGMKALAKTLIGGGVLASLGAAIVGIFHYFARVGQ
jgi:hypothetical protein